MVKKGRVYIVIAIFTLALLMLLQYNSDKEINWFPSYVAQHKIPYGTYVFNDIVNKTFGEKIRQVTVPPFEFLNEGQETEGTYFFANENIDFGESELNSLLDWTSKGNTLFIASRQFEEVFLDTLNLEISNLYSGFGEGQKQFHRLVHPKLKTEEGYSFEKDSYATFLNKIDTLKTTVIGTVDFFNEDGSAQEKNFNVVKQPFGKGEIYLSTFPKAFTNYFILQESNKDYTAGLLSYLDGSRTIYIDNYYKSGKARYTSPMHIFLNTKEFKWAYYIALIGALLYVVFEGKRKQRAIPVVLPLKNQTLAFTRTIADMYFEKGEAQAISEHKIAYFMEYIRSHLYMGTEEPNDEFYRNLASRSNQTVDDVKALFKLMERIKKSDSLADSELLKLNTLIENFKQKAYGK
ncbi:DUF4350 domain-containing protein [Maribacter algicola]|uniref:DUF4350 domain-containing protein n=1 Tax=Meishania litoralis TaxID=3434685 RepID=A0ACC7LNW6_9FLAO